MVQAGMNVSNHLVLNEISASNVHFEPKVHAGWIFMDRMDFCAWMSRRGANMVFAIECASLGIPTTGPLKPVEWLRLYVVKGTRDSFSKAVLGASIRGAGG